MISNPAEQVILGIDPGTNILGYGIIIGVKNTIKIGSCGILKMKSSDAHFQKLDDIFTCIDALIKKYKPQAMAIEAPFYGKNVQSMLKLGRAQGAAILAGTQNMLDIHEYSPRRIKQAITGNGNASKEQVAKMLHSLYQIKLSTKQLDETDAIAVAVCHYFGGSRFNSSESSFKNWGDFLKNNPERKGS